MYAVLSKETFEYPVKLITWIYGLKIKAKTNKKKENKKKEKRKKKEKCKQKGFSIF